MRMEPIIAPERRNERGTGLAPEQGDKHGLTGIYSSKKI